MKAAQVVSGVGWSAAATVVNALSQLAFLALLARLLEPAAFGLMAMAAIALRFASFLAQLGFVQALIQKPELRRQDTSAALLMALGLGLVLYVVVLVAAPLFAAYFHSPELPDVLAGLGASLLTGTLAGLPIALLRRGGRFKAAAATESAGYLLGFGAVGLPLAAAGWGVWSLVAATLAQQVLTATIGFALARPRLGWPVQRDAFAHFWHFGARYSLIGLAEFAWSSVDSLVIGRVFGKVELGVFNRAQTLTQLPVEQAVTAVNKVMFPALSSLAGDARRVADAFCMLLLAVGIVGAALACGTAAAAGDVVALLLGARWAEAVPVVAIIAFAVPPMFMYVVCGCTLDSIAALGPKLRLQAVLLVAKVALAIAVADAGLAAIAAAVVAAEVVRLLFGLRLVMRMLVIRPADAWTALAASAGTGLAVYTAVSLAAFAPVAAPWPLIARVAVEAGAGALALALALWIVVATLPAYPPLARFESVRLWHARLRAGLRLAPAQR